MCWGRIPVRAERVDGEFNGIARVVVVQRRARREREVGVRIQLDRRREPLLVDTVDGQGREDHPLRWHHKHRFPLVQRRANVLSCRHLLR